MISSTVASHFTCFSATHQSTDVKCVQSILPRRNRQTEGTHFLQTLCLVWSRLSPFFIAPLPSSVLVLRRHVELRCPFQLPALPTEAFELWFLRNCGVTTLRADKPAFRARQHWPKVIIQDAVGAANDLSHFDRSPQDRSSLADVCLTFLGLVFELGPFHGYSPGIFCRPPA